MADAEIMISDYNAALELGELPFEVGVQESPPMAPQRTAAYEPILEISICH